MPRYVKTASNGLPIAFYDCSFFKAPIGAQKINDEQYHTLLTKPETTTFIDGVLGSIPAPAVTRSPKILAHIAMSEGLAITSTGNAATLDGTYSLSGQTAALASDLVSLIIANGGAFPGGAPNWAWPDKSGALHLFPSTIEFIAFQKAIAAYRLELFKVIWGVTDTLPAAGATIP